VMAKSTIVGDSIEEYRKHAAGLRTLIRSVSVDASKAACEAFRSAGHAAAHLDGKTPEGERTRTFEAFARGDLTHLFNVDLFSEGIDIPGVECCMDLRPTESLTLFLQFIGRMLRPAPGKACGVYLDHVGNVARHGLPDEVREWSLDGRKRAKKPAAVYTCKHCYGTFGAPFRYCPNCGEAVSVNLSARAAPEQVDGELRELNADMLAAERARRTYDPARGRAQTLEELTEYARQKGYKPGWAKYIFDARQKKPPRVTELMGKHGMQKESAYSFVREWHEQDDGKSLSSDAPF
jgi:superfamily II DNA or RNA helicase